MSMERERMPGGAPTDDVVSVPEAEEEIRPEGGAGSAAMPAPPEERGAGTREPLLPTDRSASYRDRWERVQAGFVDEPRSAVEEADRLVLEVIHELQSSFTAEREALETQWQRGDEVETEDLRVALQRYRSFFDRLLSA